MKFLKQADVKDKRVLVRVGYDVPLNDAGQITDDLRIQESLSTINWLRSQGAKVILLSHLGRPDGRLEVEDSLLPVAQYLETLLQERVEFITEKMEERITPLINDLKDKDVIMLENLRFHPGEEKNDPLFAKWLASLGDLYVNDAFSDCHRSHASIVSLPKLLPGFAGLGLEKEVTNLTNFLEKPVRPVVAVIGGAKLESKLPVIKNLLPLVDSILIGSKFVGEKLPQSEKIIMPVDTLKDDSGAILDIGPKTILMYEKLVSGAKTIFWSGPLGLFENELYSQGTKKIAEAIGKNPGQSVVGGGDTIAALRKFDQLNKVKYTSTGGSAMLDFVSGKKLPGLEALEN